MAENKEEILADFQSITAIEDVGEAFSHLEECNWDIMAAIQRVMPSETPLVAATAEEYSPTLPIRTAQAHHRNQDHMEGSHMPSSTLNSNFAIPTANRWNFTEMDDHTESIPSTSTDANIVDLTSDIDLRKESKLLKFNIHFNEKVYTILISSSATIGDLKDKIYKLTKVASCHQAIRGWPPSKFGGTRHSESRLYNLNLANENDLILIDLSNDRYMDDDCNQVIEKLNENFVLNIIQEPKGTKYSLSFPGHEQILSVKTSVYTVTDIPVRHQDWTGWPPGVTNSTKLAQSGIDLEHTLILRSTADEEPKINSNSGRNSNMGNNDSDSSAEYVDADDAFFTEPPARPRVKNLIPDNTDDETIGSLQFVENYVERYGEPHPVFFQGSLEDALKEACHRPAKDRKLLAIYLHHDGSVLTNVFCDQLLRCESVMQTLMQNFILYGWDLTFESNKNLFLSSISACVGVTASMTVRNMAVDRLPAILIIVKNRSTCEVLSVINGNVGVDDLLSRLMEAVELYSEQVRVEVREESERAAREQVKYEQDMAYQQTLEADMAKEAARRQKEQALAAERKRLESEQAEIEAVKEAIRREAEMALPPEPETEMGDNVTKIRIRMPTGEHLERRFYRNNMLQALLNFITSKGFPISDYKVISLWPRKDLTTLSPNVTLDSLKLYPQETVTLEER